MQLCFRRSGYYSGPFLRNRPHAATIDYDHNTNFGQYKTYTWAKIQTNDSLWDARVKKAVDNETGRQGLGRKFHPAAWCF